MRTKVIINNLNGNKKGIRNYAYLIADMSEGSTNAFVMAFDVDNDSAWTIQAGDGVETAKDMITWEGVKRVEIYDHSVDMSCQNATRVEYVYITTSDSLNQYLSDRDSADFVIVDNKTDKNARLADAPTGVEKTGNNTAKVLAALAVIAAQNPEGYTVDAQTLQPVTSGYAVALAATQNSFGPEGLNRVVNYVAAHNGVNAFGGWMDQETGLYYYDATVIVNDLDVALALARENDQLAIFDLNTFAEIRLK